MKKRPLSLRTEGDNNRGTTSGSSAPHDTDLTASNNASRCFGRPRPPLLLFQAGHSGRYFSGFSHCLAPTGSSLAEKESLTSSLQRVCQIILTRIMQFVKVLLNFIGFKDFMISYNQPTDANRASKNKYDNRNSHQGFHPDAAESASGAKPERN